jgi:Ca-activated chloride channel homolog
VLCRFTAFVAADTRVVTDGTGPHRVTQPVELPAGWDPAGLGLPPAFGWHAAGGPAPPSGMPAPARAASRARSAPPMRARKAASPAAGDRVATAASGVQGTAASGARGTAASGARGTAASGARGTAASGARGTGEAPRLVLARRQMADEAAALRTAQGAPDAERAWMLADLATRLEAMAAWLAADPAAAGQPTGLAAGQPTGLAAGQSTGLAAGLAGLARQLRACDEPGAPRGADLDALWAEAIRLLTEFAGSGPAGRPEFWKRPR